MVCPLHIMLPVIPDKLKPMLAMVEPSPSTGPHLEIPLPLQGVCEMVLLEYLHQITPAHQELHSFHQQKEVMEEELHQDPQWLQQHLIHHLRASIVTLQQEITSLDHPIIGSQWQACAQLGQERLGWLASQLDEEDSNSYNYHSHQAQLHHHLQHMQTQL